MIYGSCISWASDTKPATKEIYPVTRLRPARRRRRRPPARPHAFSTRCSPTHTTSRAQVSLDDRKKLDEYLESIRDIETAHRPRRRTTAGSRAGGRRSRPRHATSRESLPQNIPDHMRLMLDLIVLAFQMDKTRVATCMLNNDLSQMNFGFLEGVQGSLHLDLTHNGHVPELEAMYLRDEPVSRRAVRLPGRPAEEDRRGRGHAAGQLPADVLLEPLRRRQAPGRRNADPARRPRRRQPAHRPRPRLQRPRQRQPPRVQPLPVAHGPHGRPRGHPAPSGSPES